MSSSPSAGPATGTATDPSLSLWAGLARKALQATAIRPRLPSRYESAVGGPGASAAWAPDTEAPLATPAEARMPTNGTLRQASTPSAFDTAPFSPAPADAQPHGAPAAAQATVRAPVLGEPASVRPPTGAPERQADATPPAGAPPVRRLLGDDPLRQAGPVVSMPTNLREGAVATSGGLSEPPPRASAAAPRTFDPALALRARIAQQVPRLLDEVGSPAPRSPPLAGGDPPSVAAGPLWAGPAAPRVDITIGSIAIVLTPASVAAPARAAAPAATPAVQSLDAYLQARLRRGGR